MNFWCFTPAVFNLCKDMFDRFIKENKSNPKAELYVVDVGAEFIRKPGHVLKVLPTSSEWFGVTYKEDAPGVQASISNLVGRGQYPENLWAPHTGS